MAKLRWDLESNNHKPWVTFFNFKYKLPTTHPRRCNTSSIFKGIFKDKNIFTQNTTYLVKNGRSINLWNDRWVNNLPLKNQLIGPLPLGEMEKSIFSIIITSNGSTSWNLDNIPFPIPQHIADRIKSIALPINPQKLERLSFGTYQKMEISHLNHPITLFIILPPLTFRLGLESFK